jgi:hypothetical protein
MFSNFVKEKLKIICGGFACRQDMTIREFRFRFHSILCHVQYSDVFYLTNSMDNPCLVHPVALAINKKNETPLFVTVFVVLSTLHYYMFRPT